VEEGFLLGAWADWVSLVVFAGLLLVSWVVVHAGVKRR